MASSSTKNGLAQPSKTCRAIAEQMAEEGQQNGTHVLVPVLPMARCPLMARGSLLSSLRCSSSITSACHVSFTTRCTHSYACDDALVPTLAPMPLFLRLHRCRCSYTCTDALVPTLAPRTVRTGGDMRATRACHGTFSGQVMLLTVRAANDPEFTAGKSCVLTVRAVNTRTGCEYSNGSLR